ncbi:hypothetical protein [Microcoleus sp. FACHB-831]|uniref:hypothetical protein n=1 Tax=Microcoleus sp. FACHB-831 TaxID=2692827 RepID=UPI0016877223|nr:hypothetical protein [Microcoleus sp. FACHB-831]
MSFVNCDRSSGTWCSILLQPIVKNHQRGKSMSDIVAIETTMTISTQYAALTEFLS